MMIDCDANFKPAMETVFKEEGGYANVYQDKGGATDYGISLGFLKSLGSSGDLNHDGVVDERDVKTIGKDKAREIYKKEFWDKQGYGRIHNEIMAAAIFNFAVNMGCSTVNKLVQKSINLHAEKQILKEDGIFGDETIRALNASNPLKFMLFFRSFVTWRYIQITEKNPSQKKFINGWLKRVWGGL